MPFFAAKCPLWIKNRRIPGDIQDNSWLFTRVRRNGLICRPHCRELRIRPRLGDLKFVEGSCRTPLGAVLLRHERMPSGRVHTTVIARPDAVTLAIGDE